MTENDADKLKDTNIVEQELIFWYIKWQGLCILHSNEKKLYEYADALFDNGYEYEDIGSISLSIDLFNKLDDFDGFKSLNHRNKANFIVPYAKDK